MAQFPSTTSASGIWSPRQQKRDRQGNNWPGTAKEIEIFLWGAGGAGGTAGGWSYGAPGGAGGAAYGAMEFPSAPYYVLVGGAGVVNSTTSALGGGGIANRTGTDNRYGSGGGGYSAMMNANGAVQTGMAIMAGGGGGGGSSRAGFGNMGGAGGGSLGQPGASPYNGNYAYRGLGGSQTAAGADASSNSPTNSGFQGALQGGTCRTNGYGGAGGGGYWGGSAGGYAESNTMGGGGGGSGYYNSSLFSSATLYPGNGTYAGLYSNQFRGTAGNAGAAGVNGTEGKVVIRYLGTPIATGGTITQSGGYTYHTFTSSAWFVPTTSTVDLGAGGGFSAANSVSTNGTNLTNNTMTNYYTNVTNQGSCDGDWLNYDHVISQSNFAFHSGHQVPAWWYGYAVVNVTSGTPRVLNQIRWKAHTNAIGNVNIWGSNQNITSGNYTTTTLYSFLGRCNFGGQGGGGSDGTVKTQTFNPGNYGYRWYLLEMVDIAVPLAYSAVGGQGGWAMYGLTFDKT